MKRITIIGLAALCALALSAIGVSGASAAETTAFTCLPGAGGFSDADCTEPGGTAFHHEVIPANTSTGLELKGQGVQKLEATIGGAAVILEGTGLSCMNCMAENSGGVGSMKVSGSGGTLTYTGVTVKNLPECTVQQFQAPNTNGVVQTQELKFETIATEEALIAPVSGTLLAKFNITGATCLIAGTYEVTGDATGKVSGSILTVNVTKAMKTLKVGVNPAALTGKATIEAGVTGSTYHATALT